MGNGRDPEGEYKWPWSITDREFGALEQELKEIRHDLRNLKTIVDNSGISSVTKEEVGEMREGYTRFRQHIKSAGASSDVHTIDIKKFNDDLTKLKIKVYTAFSVIGILSAIVVWLIDVAFKAMDKI